MNKVFLILVMILTVIINVFSQHDPAAKKILDKFTQKALSHYPVEIHFQYVYESVIENETTIEEGKLILNNNKFRLSIGESEVYCNGNILWNHLVTAEEVYISNPEETLEGDEFFISNPSQLFTFYNQNFKYRLTRETEYNGTSYYEVDLFPDDLNKSYHTIKLIINKANYQLYSVETKGKHGVNHIITIQNYKPGIKIREDIFSFDPADHPGIEIIDTRL